MLGDKTTVMGVRLTDYQREKIKQIAKERGVSDTDYVRSLIDNAIDGKIDLDTDVRSLKRIAEILTQRLIDLVVEQIESC